MNNQREIDDNERNCLDLIEETLIEDITNYEIIKTEDIYDDDEDIVSNGGRVLNFVNLSRTFKKARESNIKLIEEINWPNGFYRKDIGFNVIE